MQLLSLFSDAASHITALILSILHLSASRCFADAVYQCIPSPRTFDHLYSQSRRGGGGLQRTLLLPVFGGLQMNEGVEVVSVRLS